MKIETRLLIALLCALIVFVAGCTTQQPVEKKPIKISLNTWVGYAHAFIAQEKGFFKKNGVDVELVYEPDYMKSIALYRNGNVDGVFEVYSDALFQSSEGIPVKIVYVCDYSEGADVLIGDPNLTSITDLKGKKIGVDGINSFSQLFVLSLLEKNGIKESDVYFENIPAAEVLTALETKKITAGHTWDPTKNNALKKGYKVLGNAGQVPGLITDVLVVTPSVASKRPNDIQAIVKSLVEARDFVKTNRTEAIDIMAKSEGMTTEEVISGLDGMHLLSLQDNIAAMKKTSDATSLFTSGTTISEFFMKRGQMSKMPDFDSIIDPQFVNALVKTG